MQKIKLYQIDAFTDKVFGGNPAAVCVLDNWLEAATMQQIAAENNLAETAFVVAKGDAYEIRWFTPTVEVDLCGHATLASAYVLFKYYQHPSSKINLYSYRSGHLSATKQAEELTLDFPVDSYAEIEVPQALIAAFKLKPKAAFKGKTDFMLIYENQQEIESMHPDLKLVESVGGRGVIVSAPGNEVDFVSRFFAPQVGITEDPVTGSAHTTLTPYWSQQLGKMVLTAKQLSKRQGSLTCELAGDRVKITGTAVTYLTGEIEI